MSELFGFGPERVLKQQYTLCTYFSVEYTPSAPIEPTSQFTNYMMPYSKTLLYTSKIAFNSLREYCMYELRLDVYSLRSCSSA